MESGWEVTNGFVHFASSDTQRFGYVSYAIFELCNHADKRARWEPAQFDPESSKLTKRVMRVRFQANEKR